MHNTTTAGFEPTRGDPIGFQVQHLNHSVMLPSVTGARVRSEPPWSIKRGFEPSTTTAGSNPRLQRRVRTLDYSGVRTLDCLRVRTLTTGGFEPATGIEPGFEPSTTTDRQSSEGSNPRALGLDPLGRSSVDRKRGIEPPGSMKRGHSLTRTF